MITYTLETKLKCPHCGWRNSVGVSWMQATLKTAYESWQCQSCGRKIEKKAGDHCVICSYGEAKCLQKQK